MQLKVIGNENSDLPACIPQPLLSLVEMVLVVCESTAQIAFTRFQRHCIAYIIMNQFVS